MGLLDQRGKPPGEETVAEHLARRTGVAAAGERLDALTVALADDPAPVDAQRALGVLALGGDDGGPFRRGPADVGLSADAWVPMRALSGGQAARVGRRCWCSRASPSSC